MRLPKSKEFLISGLLLVFVSLFFFQQTNLAASDLGRHIKNGELIFQSGSVFSTNLYSYTHPEFPAPNHHWLFGVISYWIHSVAGFEGLTLLSAVLYTAAVGLVFWFAKSTYGIWPAVTAVLLALPLLANRSETRPEAFSLFFYAAVLVLCSRLLELKQIKRFWYAIAVSFITVLWVNIHIFFILLIALLGAAGLHALLNKRYRTVSVIGLTSLLMLAASFVNPMGLTLVLYPFKIFGNYGYRVSENQSLWFFLQHFTQPIHWYLLGFSFISVIAILIVWRQNWKKNIFIILMTLFTLVFTLRLVRMQNIFALTCISLLATALKEMKAPLVRACKKISAHPLGLMGGSLIGFPIVVLLFATGLFFPFKPGFGIGLTPGYETTIQFLQQFPHTSPMFNNFDSGSLLIYALSPEHRVFIDNRAEAYPAEFLQKEYIAAQENEEVWQQLQEKYHFNSIIFHWHDQTNWGQEFLVRRTQDPQWIPVYVDNYLLVLLKDTEANKEYISTHQLPRSMFSSSEPR